MFKFFINKKAIKNIKNLEFPVYFETSFKKKYPWMREKDVKDVEKLLKEYLIICVKNPNYDYVPNKYVNDFFKRIHQHTDFFHHLMENVLLRNYKEWIFPDLSEGVWQSEEKASKQVAFAKEQGKQMPAVIVSNSSVKERNHLTLVVDNT